MAAGCLLAVCLLGAAPAELPAYWQSFPHPETVYVSRDMNAFPPMYEGDRGGPFGAWTFTLQSLAGLAALGVREGTCDAMVWLEQGGNVSYARWRDDALRLTGAARIDVDDPAELLRIFIERGVVKGYIVYRADESRRKPYEPVPENGAGYNNSVNAATTLAASLGAVIVEARGAATLRALGLRALMDVSERDEAWAFAEHAAQCNRGLLHLIDPKVPHLRAYAVATRSLCVFGVSELTDAALAWLEPNAPIMGWNAGDEYRMTSQLSRYAHFHTASNWIFNLPVLAAVRAGADVPWDRLQVNAGSHVDPLGLDWPEDAHFTAFVGSDGDNLQWYLGNFFDHNAFYWQAPSRGAFPMGWTAPLCSLSQVGVPALEYMARTATPNDQAVTFAAGYFYPDEYGAGTDRPEALLAAKADQFGARMNRLGAHVLVLIAKDWDGPEAVRAYGIFARRIPGLAGIFAMQYHPYNAGQGAVLWVENKQGAPIPVISARYAIWAHLSRLENIGPPALVAGRINAAPWRGTLACGHMDWCVVHQWSRFREADTRQNLLAEEIPRDEAAGAADALAGYEPTRWCVDRLEPHVRAVTPEELAWRLRLHVKPRATLTGLARQWAEAPDAAPARTRRADAYVSGLDALDWEAPETGRTAFMRLQALVKGGE